MPATTGPGAEGPLRVDPLRVGALRVGLVQLSVRTNHTDDNLARAESYVREASRQGCQLVVLPEAFATGLNLPSSHELATELTGPVAEWLAKLAAAEAVHLVAGLLERVGERVFSSVLLVDDAGEVRDVYRRRTVYELESYFLSAGTGCRVVETALGRIGLVAGYDIQFPEVLRGMFAQQVELLVCPAMLLRPFVEPVRLMVRARAAENCCYLLFCSATGENTLAGLTYMGASAVVRGPLGVRSYSNQFREQEPVLAAADREEGLLVADLDLADLRRLQQIHPLAKDFRRTPLCEVLVAANQRCEETTNGASR